MLQLRIEKYRSDIEQQWDDFVLNKSINGTFLQTKNFLNYHGNKFEDASLIIYKGSNTIVAVIPAVCIYENGKKKFSSHCGSTFGGIVISKTFYNIQHMEAIFLLIEDYLTAEHFHEAEFKCTSAIFASGNIELLYYFFYQKGYHSNDELSFYIDFNHYNPDISSNFTAARRRDYKYSLKSDLTFRQLFSTSEIALFHEILCENLKKYNTSPVHTLEELLDFNEKRLKNFVSFFGVFSQDNMISGSMVFYFGKKVFHTQYLAAKQDYLHLYPMNFLDTNLIALARANGFRFFSFGISTENHGKFLNKHLAQFKEGFGTEYMLNRTFVKKLKE